MVAMVSLVLNSPSPYPCEEMEVMMSKNSKATPIVETFFKELDTIHTVEFPYDDQNILWLKICFKKRSLRATESVFQIQWTKGNQTFYLTGENAVKPLIWEEWT